ncbi:unnamed protein product [Rotaria magnacalcarata]|uniref:Uncharacterized protein n=3 Tax=Rotaria magnacalcarata TaxID=392030 RepID=A0A815JSI2_9BILA|nr:unnamed protein product [Rotaria magnacalcarata]CAF3719207.1 unnamed protein product [Rotaria magnacalcarata]CAF3948756.1 unnamed protein product [Rotaria magnacalcarata]CAF4036905.1 unnamed protein product [Rotaria magnacalcarata]CAF4098493.1 unnamed protein product [Rotaria magnacalcarata]
MVNGAFGYDIMQLNASSSDHHIALGLMALKTMNHSEQNKPTNIKISIIFNIKKLILKMNIQLSTLFFICIAFAIPLLALSTSRQELEETLLDDIGNDLNRYVKSNHQPFRSLVYKDHGILKKAADFEQILKPCNRMPASGRGNEYADCVRSRMLLMGRRK